MKLRKGERRRTEDNVEVTPEPEFSRKLSAEM
jgi:hypothetical protein